MKRFLLVALLIVGVLMVSAGVAGAQDAKLKFIMIAHGSPAGNPFWSTVEKGMVDACALLLEADIVILNVKSLNHFATCFRRPRTDRPKQFFGTQYQALRREVAHV
jgi:ABC-type sugar transport system substrate-binding protein